MEYCRTSIATVAAIYYSHKQEKDLVDKQKQLVDAQKELAELQKKQNEFAALTEIFRLLDDNAHRYARRGIINLYTDNSEEEQWGVLVLMNAVKKDDEYNEYLLWSNYLESKKIIKD